MPDPRSPRKALLTRARVPTGVSVRGSRAVSVRRSIRACGASACDSAHWQRPTFPAALMTAEKKVTLLSRRPAFLSADAPLASSLPLPCGHTHAHMSGPQVGSPLPPPSGVRGEGRAPSRTGNRVVVGPAASGDAPTRAVRGLPCSRRARGRRSVVRRRPAPGARRRSALLDAGARSAWERDCFAARPRRRRSISPVTFGVGRGCGATFDRGEN